MSKFRYSQEMLRFLQEGYREMQIPELTAAFNQAFSLNKTKAQIRCCLSNHKFRCGRPVGSPKGTFRLFTKEQAEFIRASYQQLSIRELTDKVNETFATEYSTTQIRSFTRNNKVQSGRTGRFQAGQKPWNAGMKGFQAGGRSKETQFKKGSMSGAAQHNYKPIGSTRITKDGYIERKVTDDHPVPARRWIGEHRLVWEAANGPIPDAHVLVMLDGDKLNCDLDNLRCVHRGVLQYLNKTKLNNTTGEARKAAILTAEVATRSKQLERKQA